jgi:FkbM family methyltransferase
MIASQIAPRSASFREVCLSLLLRSVPIKHGRHRLLSILKPKRWSGVSEVVYSKFHHKIIIMNIGDLVGWHFFILRDFDPEVSEILIKHGANVDSKSPIFWDIGANKGACSYQVAAALPTCKLVAIEPQKNFAQLTRRNLDFLATGRNEVFEVGIGTEPGQCELYVPRSNAGGASLIHTYASEYREALDTQMVAIKTANEIFNLSQYGWPTMVKIDVEGFEYNVIKSLEPAFEGRFINCCVFECYEDNEENFCKISSFVADFAYKIFAIRRNLFTTWLEAAKSTVAGTTDYAIIKQ